MDAISEARVIQKDIQEYKREIIGLEKELKKNTFEEAFQAKANIQEKLKQEMINLNQELQQLKQEISKIKHNQEETEKEEANNLRQKIEKIKKENNHLMAQDDQLKKTDQLLAISEQNYIYGVYQRRLGPIERENAEISKKIKKCEEDIEKLKNKCEKVKARYPSSYVEKLKAAQDRYNDTLRQENGLRNELISLEEEVNRLKDIPKQNPDEIKSAISELNVQIEKDKSKLIKLERKIKDKTQELRLAKLTFPKSNGSHNLYKEIELLSCILVDKMGELSEVTGEVEEIQNKLNSFRN